LSNDDFLYDFEYLINTLEDNWPFINIANELNDVSMNELANNIRNKLTDTNFNIGSAHDFNSFLLENFFIPIGWLGHLQSVWNYNDFFDHKTQLEHASRRSSRISFEGTSYEDMFSLETLVFYDSLREQSLQNGESNNDAIYTPVVETAILVENEIAMITINSMIHAEWDPGIHRREGWAVPGWGRYERILYNFFNSIEGYEHLIIDLRNNPGGVHSHFDTFITGRLLNEQIYLPSFIFYLNKETATEARNNRKLNHFLLWNEVMTEINQENIYQNLQLPYLDASLNFEYALKSSYHISPLNQIKCPNGWGFMWASADGSTTFDGQVWILVNERTGSGAEAVTAMLKYNNIAVVVGEATAGIFGTTYDNPIIAVSLPNTGILVYFYTGYFTDMQGHPFEGFGIQPHYFNLPNMDALETVLTIINERRNFQ